MTVTEVRFVFCALFAQFAQPLCNVNRKEIVEFLLANEPDVNARNNEGNTPLFGPAGCGYTDIVKLLLAKGADVNALTSFRHSTLAPSSPPKPCQSTPKPKTQSQAPKIPSNSVPVRLFYFLFWYDGVLTHFPGDLGQPGWKAWTASISQILFSI